MTAQTITKSDFMLYQDAPVHLWAKKHGSYIEPEASEYNQHLARQGYEIENLAQSFLKQTLESKNYIFNFQTNVMDGLFQARIDALAYDTKADVYDIYEVKSTTEVKNDQLFDAGFQMLVAQKSLSIRTVNVVVLNKDYSRAGDLDLSELFLISPVNSGIQLIKDDLTTEMKDALDTLRTKNYANLAVCLKPKICPCLDICHPELPGYSIFDIASLYKNKLIQLKEEKILAIIDVPEDFKLSIKQQLQVRAAKSGEALIDKSRIKRDLDKLEYPLYFLDYETFNSATPLYDGYHPHQQMTFQYSLHIVPTAEAKDSLIEHKEFLATKRVDPGKQLMKKLRQDIGDTGSILVWNKTFEAGRNKEMAQLYPEYADFLLGLNERIYDLADSFKKGWYVHPDFRGSWSIKNILPVLVEDLTYDGLAIAKGDQAMLAWWKMVYGDASTTDVAVGESTPVRKLRIGAKLNKDETDIAKSLLQYCKLDTWAMVEIWKKLMLI